MYRFGRRIMREQPGRMGRRLGLTSLTIVAQLDTWELQESAFVTELVVSELVTNAIRYGEPPVQLPLIRDRTLICEVSDASSTTPHLRHARTFDEGGRGLLLVANLTQRRGSRQTTSGKTGLVRAGTERMTRAALRPRLGFRPCGTTSLGIRTA
jgi:hypothetical protein